MKTKINLNNQTILITGAAGFIGALIEQAAEFMKNVPAKPGKVDDFEI